MHDGVLVCERSVNRRIGQSNVGGVLHGPAGHAHAHVTHSRPTIGPEIFLVVAKNVFQMHERRSDIGINLRRCVDVDGNGRLYPLERVSVAKIIAHRHGDQVCGNHLVKLPRPKPCAVGHVE